MRVRRKKRNIFGKEESILSYQRGSGCG